MTRTRLEPLLGERKRFSGIFVREGRKRAYKGSGTLGNGYDATVLLKDIRDEQGRIVTDHLWFNNTQGFEDTLMVEGEVVSFNARVGDYLKGYEKDDYDYKLSRPSKIVAHGLPEWDDYDGPDAYRNKPVARVLMEAEAAGLRYVRAAGELERPDSSAPLTSTITVALDGRQIVSN